MNMTTNLKATAPVIEAIGLQKNYGPLEVLKGLDLSLERGEVVALIGPSGSGKSTFIRCLNMMEIPTGGTIRFRQKRVGDRFRDKGEDIGIGTLRRHVGMVFQTGKLSTFFLNSATDRIDCGAKYHSAARS